MVTARQISVREHGHIYPHTDPRGQPGSLSRAYVTARHFDALAELDSRREHSIFEWCRDHARARQWVGVVQIPGLSIELLPKIDAHGEKPALARGNLLYMLALAGRVPLREDDLADLDVHRAPLQELLIALFARQAIAALRQGVHRDYVQRCENLPALRGRLQFNRHIALNAANRARFFVEHDDFTTDNPLNQVLLAVVTLLIRTTRSRETLRLLSRALACLEGVRLRAVTVEDIDRLHHDRRTQRFSNILSFCRLVLAQQSPTPRAGEARTFALLFDMNVIFERFVAHFLRKHVLARTEYRSHTQGGMRRFLARSGGRDVVTLKPDIVVCRGDEPPLVIDTKWKRVAQRDRVSRTDLYQMFVYASRYGAARCILAYPELPGSKAKDYDVEVNGGAATLQTRFIPLGLRLPQERETLAASLRERFGLSGGVGEPLVTEALSAGRSAQAARSGELT